MPGMEMTVTVFEPAAARGRDLIIELDRVRTAGELIEELALLRDRPVRGLFINGEPIDPTMRLGLAPLLHGAELGFEIGSGRRTAESVIRLHVAGGPDAGHVRGLTGTTVVGRGSGCDLQIADPAMSRAHVAITVERTGIHLNDLGSTNGTRGVSQVRDGDLVTVGSSRLRLAPPATAPLLASSLGDGRIDVAAARSPGPTLATTTITLPEAPGSPAPPRIPWAAALMSIPLAAVLAFVVGPALLWLAIMGPLLALGGASAERWLSRRRHRLACAADRATLEQVTAQVADVLQAQSRTLDETFPDPARLLDCALRRTAPLWGTARAEPGFATLRLGWGHPQARITLEQPGRPRSPTPPGLRMPLRHSDAPVVLDLLAAGALVVRGHPEHVRRVIDGLVGQLAVRHRPADLTIDVVDGPEQPWRWLPHSPDVPRVDRSIASQLRTRRRSWAQPTPETGQYVVVVPQVTEVSELTTLLADAHAAGLIAIAGCEALAVPADVPVLEVDPVGGILQVGEDRTPLHPDRVGLAWVHRITRALAPLADPECRRRRAAPRSADRSRALAVDWAERQVGPDRAIATIGVQATGPWQIDLDRDGPHILVGGTTGSGKSELLRTLIAALAAQLPPEDLSFVLVDYKGGASFGACARLPHTAGLLTDLGPGLASRALRALRAEVTRRERVLAEHGVSDRAAYLASVDDPAERARVARLVIVIDEFRALAQDQPDVLAGIIHLAAVGRSLGVHLVLATQRPGGVIGPDIRANVNLRIALRVRDRHDSLDVIDAPDAATLPAEPGHALARTGDGELVPFNVIALCLPRPGVGPAIRWADAAIPQVAVGTPTQLDALVDEICAEAGRRESPRPPRIWLPPLEEQVESAALADPGAFALCDLPDEQRQVPLAWRPGDGSVLIIGGARSGRTTALRTLVEAIAHRHSPDRVHVHVLAAHPERIADSRLAHLGTTTGDLRRARTLLQRLLDDTPRSSDLAPHVVLVVDDLEALDGPQRLEPTDLRDLLTRLAGADLGHVSVIATGGRAAAGSPFGRHAARLLVLAFDDVADRALVGIRTSDAPTPWPPGRMLLRGPHDAWVQAQVALPGTRAPLPGLRTALVLAELPDRLLASDLPPVTQGWPIALSAEPRSTLGWLPSRDGRRILVVGAAGSGRTSTLRRFAWAHAASGRPVAWVAGKGQPPSAPLPTLVTVVTPDAPEPLVALRRRHPDLLVLVDDAELLRDTAVEPIVNEIARLVDRDDAAIVVAVDGSAPPQVRGLVPSIASYRCGLILQPGDRSAGDLLGLRRLEPLDGTPGRAYVVRHGHPIEVQVALEPSSMPDRDDHDTNHILSGDWGDPAMTA